MSDLVAGVAEVRELDHAFTASEYRALGESMANRLVELCSKASASVELSRAKTASYQLTSRTVVPLDIEENDYVLLSREGKTDEAGTTKLDPVWDQLGQVKKRH